MKIAYKHLLNLLVDKPEINDLSDQLFQLGHEHEIEDSIFDMEFTPNRGDCLSLLGLARDLNVFYETNLNLPIYEDEIPSLSIDFINQAPEACPEICFLQIEIDGDVSNYKDYLEDYFVDLKINKNNFFTDVGNFIAYEMGQPTHSYDYSVLDGPITLLINEKDTQFKTLLGKNIQLKGSDLIFTDEHGVINLAGIIGGKNSSCKKNTKSVLIECAYFFPESIIGKSVKYDLHSDASHKFERGVDPKCHDKALRRFIHIVKEHANITKLEIYTNSHENIKEIELDLDVNQVNKILGTNESVETYSNCLQKLGFVIKKNKIQVPSYRSDINHQNDLAEELARVVGYNNILLKPFKIPALDEYSENLNLNEVKSFLVKNGFAEVINSPFRKEKNLNAIEVDNPLDSNKRYLRTNIKESLVDNLIYNEKRQKDSIKLFEISDLYCLDNDFSKDTKLGIIISGRRGHNHIEFSKSLDKNYLVELFNSLDIDIDKNIFMIDRDKLDSKIKTPIFYIEIDLKNIYPRFSKDITNGKKNKDFIQYNPISEFPSSYRDFSFSVKDPSMIKDVIEKLSASNHEILKDSFMFDFYNNEVKNEIKIGYRFIFQSNKKTLNDNDIDGIISKIINPVIALRSVSLPGSL